MLFLRSQSQPHEPVMSSCGWKTWGSALLCMRYVVWFCVSSSLNRCGRLASHHRGSMWKPSAFLLGSGGVTGQRTRRPGISYDWIRLDQGNPQFCPGSLLRERISDHVRFGHSRCIMWADEEVYACGDESQAPFLEGDAMTAGSRVDSVDGFKHTLLLQEPRERECWKIPLRDGCGHTRTEIFECFSAL